MVLAPETPATSSSITPASIHRSSLLSQLPGIVHGITRRVEGAGKAEGNVGYSAPRDRDDAWLMRHHWMSAAGLDPNRIVVAYQTHAASVEVVTSADAGKGADPESIPIGRA